MQKKTELSDKWLKASLLGSIWAVSEIVLGSFLHNLRIPFNGNILTAIGLILMISASYKWKENGIFWRAGLICALMKTMSPSAVIFGPMIAIFMESVLFELSIRTLGMNAIGYLIGSALAMSWILFQKIFNFIIFYGFNIVDIYTQLMRFAQKQLNVSIDMVWLPVFLLLIIYILFGMIAGVIGIRTGKRLKTNSNADFSGTQSLQFDIVSHGEINFSYSLTWLFYNFIVLLGMMFYINISNSYLWVIYTIVVIIIWAYRYNRVLKQLAKLKFWLFFIIITMLTAFTVTYIQGGDGNWLKGFEIGLKMNFRAAVVIVGFSVIGTELYNPKIRDFFSRTSFRQLPVALELAFESLPKIISELPDLKIIFKNPGLVMNAMLNSAENRMNEIKKFKHSQVFIVTGAYDSGKTTYVKALLANLQEFKNRIAGIYAEKNYFDGQVKGYDLINISTGQKIVFLEIKKDDALLLNDNAKLNFGHCEELHSKSGFIISEDTLQSGIEWLNAGLNSDCDLIVIDEIGKWELKDQVWAGILTEILTSERKHILLVVRNTNLNDVIQKWNIKDPYIIEIEKTMSEDFADHLRSILR